MGREIKRVPLNFDWPINKIWPGRMLSICEEMDYIINKEKYKGERCDLCKKFAKLVGLKIEYGCPQFPFNGPPEGDAYQLWETVSEGSPMSPPFATPEELAKYLVKNKISACGLRTATYEEWMAFINGPGWALSGVLSKKGFLSGVEAVSNKD